MNDDVKKDIQEENENLEQVEEAVEEAVEEVVEETIDETVEETAEESAEETPSESVVEEHAKEDESKWAEVFSRLDALEQRIGELIIQGGFNRTNLDNDEDELSEIELENKKWYERNALMRNLY